jgi:hypothetical protein
MTLGLTCVLRSAGVALILLAAPAAASAHLRSGTVAVDDRVHVQTADATAYALNVLESDRALSLTVKPGHTVTVIGYVGEPMARLDRAGLSINAASPTAAVAGLVAKRDRVAATAPRWRLERGKHSVVWHDGRVQSLPAGLSEGAWAVPVIVDGRHTQLRGTLQRVAKPPLWPWLLVVAGAVALAVVASLRGNHDAARRAAVALALVAAGASVVLAAAFSFDVYASPGTWIASFDELFFLAIGAWFLIWGAPRWQLPAAIGVGLLTTAIGVSKGAIFFHPIVLALLPGSVTRLTVTIAIGAGLAAAIVAGASVSYSEIVATKGDPSAVETNQRSLPSTFR